MVNSQCRFLLPPAERQQNLSLFERNLSDLESNSRTMMRRIFGLCVLVASFLSILAPFARSAELDPRTIVYWDQHLGIARTQMQERANGAGSFLWVDEDPARVRRVRAGDIVVSPLAVHNPIAVPHGLIHDWIGAVFIPDATIHDLMAVVNSYERYDKIYKPTLIKARLLASSENEQKISIVWLQRVLFFTATFYSEVDCKEVALNERRGYMDIAALRLQQIVHYGQTDERRLAPDEGNGYVWRLVTFARYEERDGGLYLELEVIALSRDFSRATRLVLGPLMDRLPKELLSSKLEQTREAIESQAEERTGSRARAGPSAEMDPAR
jgi:hypothetical protein